MLRREWIRSFEFHAKVGKDGHPVRMPKVVDQLLLSVLKEIADGHAVQVVSLEQELTTQEAADRLNVSRPYLVKLLDQGRIPSRWVGSHRRVLNKDIQNYKAALWSRRKVTLDRLSELDQELGLTE